AIRARSISAREFPMAFALSSPSESRWARATSARSASTVSANRMTLERKRTSSASASQVNARSAIARPSSSRRSLRASSSSPATDDNERLCDDGTKSPQARGTRPLGTFQADTNCLFEEFTIQKRARQRQVGRATHRFVGPFSGSCQGVAKHGKTAVAVADDREGRPEDGLGFDVVAARRLTGGDGLFGNWNGAPAVTGVQHQLRVG